MEIQLIRNATLRLNYAGKMILIDPMLAPKHVAPSLLGKERNPTVDLPCAAEDVLKDIDVVIVSHLHQDHFDPFAQSALPKDITLFCQPVNAADIQEKGFTNVVPIKDNIAWDNITLTRTHAEHGFGEMIERMGPVSGFIFRADEEPTVYWTSDTVWCPSVETVVREIQPDIIITHSGGAEFEKGEPIIMTAEHTLAVCDAAPKAQVIAVHMESLDHCQTTRAELRQAAEKAGVIARIHIPADGERLTFG